MPTVRYRDVPAAIEWLCTAFGFEQQRVIKDTNGLVLYGQLTFGGGMVMVAPIQETAFGKLMVQPDEIGGVETQICYLYVADAKAHQARATAAGAEIVFDSKADSTAGRGYSCRDPEGHIWNFGTYDPWDLKTAAAPPARPRRRKRRALAALVLFGLAGGGVYMHEPSREIALDYGTVAYAKVLEAVEKARAEQADLAKSGETGDVILNELRDQLAKERIARLAADRHVKDIRDQVGVERRAREAAEIAAKEARDTAAAASVKGPDPANAQLRDDLAQVRQALTIAASKLDQARLDRDAAERGIAEARESLAQLRSAKDAAERGLKEARENIQRERNARIAAEQRAAAARKTTTTPSFFQ